MDFKTLVIIESTTKTKALQSYLGKEYKVVSSEGHVTNLSKSGELHLGIDLETFKARYTILKKSKELINNFKKIIKKSKNVILATDPDREGEAIAYHLKRILNLKEDKYNRVVFNEITKKAILKAFKNPTKINLQLYKSQETRRILDRIIGFTLSKLLYQKIKSKSAGRVQSVILKILCEREAEIKKFISEEFWTIEGEYKKNNLKLIQYNNKKIELKTEKEVINVKNNLKKEYEVTNIIESKIFKNPPKPLITSTMLQRASTFLGFSTSKTSFIAQQLYEGIKIDSEYKGLISYPRTDSTRLSETFIASLSNYIIKNFGKEYLGVYKGSIIKNNVQDAHEAIRPTQLELSPKLIKKYLTKDQFLLYKLIYSYSVSSLMSKAEFKRKKIFFSNNGYIFSMNGQVLNFDGYLKLLKLEHNSNIVIPKLKVSQKILLEKLEGIQHFTKPLSRYSVASLISYLEKLGIGRPSTYSPTIAIIQKRGYVQLENKAFVVTDKGFITNNHIQKYFNSVINENYTSYIENYLDSIFKDKINNIEFMKNFWAQFSPKLKYAKEHMEVIPLEKTGKKCPKCNSDLVFRFGRFGKFIGCSNFPKCYYSSTLEDNIINEKCPKCNSGNKIWRVNKKKQRFYGCSNFPDCDFIENYKPLNLKEKKDKNLRENNKNKLYKINLL